ncbi:MAG: NAD(P)/FAD-dependent oxidoreductase [Candidatus Eisenbacteria bacterium]
MREELVVVGAGPAGCAAAVQAMRLGLRPRLLDATGAAGGLLPNARRIENYPGLEPLSGIAMVERLRAHLERFGLRVERMRVTRVTADGAGNPLDGPHLETDAGAIEALRVETGAGVIAARCAILAVGTRPRLLPLPGVADLVGRHVFYEVRDLLRALPAPRRVLVIGGGEAALDYALTLAEAGARVTIVTRGRDFKAVGWLASQAMEHPSIGHVGGIEATGLRWVGESVQLDAPSTEHVLTADAALIAVGRESRLGDLLPPPWPRPPAIGPMGDASPGGPATVCTGIPGLLVAGDARTGELGQLGIAVGDGLTAAMEAAAYLEQRRA